MLIWSPSSWEKTEKRERRPKTSWRMKRTSRLTRTTKFCSTSWSKLVAENGVQWLQHQRSVPIDQYSQFWRDQQVWIWEWEKEKLKELKRRITHSPRDCLINRLYSRRRISIMIGNPTWNTRDWLEKCQAVKRVVYLVDQVWDNKQQVVTVCKIFLRDKYQIKLLTSKCNNNIQWRLKMVILKVKAKCKKMIQIKYNKRRWKQLTKVNKTKNQLLLMMVRTND